MEYDMSWLGTFAAIAFGITLGWLSALFVRAPRLVLVWSIVVTGIFIIAAMLAVIACYSWMFNVEARGALEQVALAAAITGLTFAIRSSD